MEQIIRLALTALSQSAPGTLRRPVASASWSAGLIFLVVLACAAGLFCLVAALWLMILPELGPTAATAIVGLAFLVVAAGIYLGYRAKTAPKPVAVAPDSSPLDEITEIQRIVSHAMGKNIGPLLLAAVLAGLIAGLRKGR